MTNRLLCGEKITLATLLGNSTLWEERYFARNTVVMLEVLIDFAGDKKDFVEDDPSVAFG